MTNLAMGGARGREYSTIPSIHLYQCRFELNLEFVFPQFAVDRLPPHRQTVHPLGIISLLRGSIRMNY